MNKKVGIAFAVLLGLVTTTSYMSDFQIIPGRDIPIYLSVTMTVGMLMLFSARLSIWLKLFLLFVLSNPIFAMNPTEAGICVGGIVFFYLAYLFLINFNRDEMCNLLKLLPIVAAIQVIWILLERVNCGNWSTWVFKSGDFVGTIGYVNLVGLLIASIFPLTLLYRRKWSVLTLLGIGFTRTLFSCFIILFGTALMVYKKYKVLMVCLVLGMVLMIPVGIKRFAVPTTRLHMCKVSLAEIKKRPLVGTGFGSYKVLKHPKEKEITGFYPVCKPTPYSIQRPGGGHAEIVRTFHPHNTFLRVWREGGLFCALAILMFIGSTIIDFLRSDKTEVQRAIFGSLSGLHIGAMFSFPERSVGIVAVWIVLIAAHRVLVRRKI